MRDPFLFRPAAPEAYMRDGFSKARRGKVLRDASSGCGLLVIGGQQYPFSLEGTWHSTAAARPGMVVDVTFDSAGNIRDITAARDSEEFASNTRKNENTHTSLVYGRSGSTLLACAVLAVTWCWLTAFSARMPLTGQCDFTFWDALTFLNTRSAADAMMPPGQSSAGWFGLGAVLTLTAAVLGCLSNSRVATSGGLFPLLFTLATGVTFRMAIGEEISRANAMVEAAQSNLNTQISLGLGIYLSGLASLYLAALSARSYLAANAPEMPKPQQERAATA